jgi:hypothetical protein
MRKTLLILPLSIVLAGFGCGQIATEAIINRELGGQGNVRLNDNTVSYTGQNGETASYGENVTIPSDFPSDVPVYAGGTVIAVTNAADGASLTFTTSDSIDTVMTWYDSQLSDWTKSADLAYSGSHTVQYEKDGVQIAVNASASGDTTSVVVIRTQE